ncbi:hypothetical protein F4780DRAFT_294028 [Xylariomycetidae sp. FL0641]|nr:hypothetical protein F4780DRAFT_294028 [Xylariomycetidae sp. FL0641]
MASLLRQIVAGPRARHPEAGLDLCYVTDNIIATSGPSQTYPQRAYRNPLDRLVAFLDAKHGKDWAIWEFRGEGTGYPDSLVYNRIRHYPWPDHHPPPFHLVPMIVASMRNWLCGNDLDADGGDHTGNSNNTDGKKKLVSKVLDTWKDKKTDRVVVVHCKAGKGRSGTMACSYLIAECGWTPEEAIARFTERRMKPKFGPGVSIPSQRRWIGYVDRWAKGGKTYLDRELEILEIHVWGLRNGVKLAVEGFVDEGKRIKVFHTFRKKERHVVEGNAPGGTGMVNMMYDLAGYGSNSASPSPSQTEAGGAKAGTDEQKDTESPVSSPDTPGTPASDNSKALPKKPPTLITKDIPTTSKHDSGPESANSKSQKLTSSSSTSLNKLKDKWDPEPGGMAVIFKPEEPVRLPNSDVNICIERRNRAPSSMGLTMVTAVAHVWFNTFFEGNGPEQNGKPDENGVFEIEWDKMDGIKGSSQKGTRACDRIAVVWRSVKPESGKSDVLIREPGTDSPVPQMRPADWKGVSDEDPESEKHLGLRVRSPESADVSQASSIKGESSAEPISKGQNSPDVMEGVRSDVPPRKGQGIAGPSSEDAKAQTERTNTESPKSDESLDAYARKLPNPEGSGQ